MKQKLLFLSVSLFFAFAILMIPKTSSAFLDEDNIYICNAGFYFYGGMGPEGAMRVVTTTEPYCEGSIVTDSYVLYEAANVFYDAYTWKIKSKEAYYRVTDHVMKALYNQHRVRILQETEDGYQLREIYTYAQTAPPEHSTCETTEPTDTDGGSSTIFECSNPIEMGTHGNIVNINDSQCVKFGDSIPYWYTPGTQSIKLQISYLSGASYPVSFQWENLCSGTEGSASFTEDWESIFIGSVSPSCETKIKFTDSGNGQFDFRYWIE